MDQEKQNFSRGNNMNEFESGQKRTTAKPDDAQCTSAAISKRPQDSPEARPARKPFSRRGRGGRGSRSGTIVIIVLFMLFLQEFLGSSCLSVAVFGIPCAGCGSSRAVQLLLQGRMREALTMHPLILLTLAFVIIIPLFMLLRFLRKKRGKKTFLPLSARAVNIFFITLALIYFVVYVVRMILYFPHTEPMLYNSNSVVGHIISFVRRLLSS